MNKLKLAEQRGFSQMFLLVGMLLVAVSLPIATNLVQKNQENRSSAKEEEETTVSTTCTVSSYPAKCSGDIKLFCSNGNKTAKTCTNGCTDGKCKCKYDGSYYRSGSVFCHTSAGYGYKMSCNEGSWSSVRCENGCNSTNTTCATTTPAKTSCTYLGGTLASGASKCYGGNQLFTCGSNGGSATSKECKCVTGSSVCTPINGVCGGTKNSCTAGNVSSVSETTSEYKWVCEGLYDGSSKTCSLSKSDCGLSKNTCNAGDYEDVSDAANYYYWKCGTKTCSLAKPTPTLTAEQEKCAKYKVAECSNVGCFWNTATSKCIPKEKSCGEYKVAECNNVGCFWNTATSKCTNEVSGVSLKEESITLTVRHYRDITATVTPDKAVTVLTWKSDNEKVATVDASGRVTGVSVGIANVTVKTANGKTDSLKVTVVDDGMILSPNNFIIKVGGTKQMTVSFGSKATKTVTWSVGNDSIIGVSSGGLVTGRAEGTTTVMATSSDGIVASATVSVTGSSNIAAPYGSNSSACKKLGGICTDYTSVLSEGAKCRVYNYSVEGTIQPGICPGDSTVLCCTGVTTKDDSSDDNNDGGGGDNTPTVVYATGITLSPTTLSLTVGGSATITATVVPSDTTDQTITWSSGATNVATVNTSGVVTAVAVGNAVITAKTSNNKTATVSVTVASVTSPRISFKFSLRGIKPSYTKADGSTYDCFSSLGNLVLDVVNSPTNTYQVGLSLPFTVVASEINVLGDQVFQVSATALDATKFSSVNTFNYLKIKGPFHVKRRMCADGQTAKLAETTVCNIDLKSDKVYDFSDYTLLAGDINKDGLVNSVDYGIVKTNFDADASISCGRTGDLNMDGVVNSIDGNLISKEALSSRDDE